MMRDQAFAECVLYNSDGEAICRGANGRKMRQDCGYCPNYRNWIKKTKQKQETMKEKEGEGHD